MTKGPFADDTRRLVGRVEAVFADEQLSLCLATLATMLCAVLEAERLATQSIAAADLARNLRALIVALSIEYNKKYGPATVAD